MRTAKMLLGSCLVYVACSVASASRDSGGAGRAGQGGTGLSGLDASARGGRLIDALADPVTEAVGALPPDVAVETCDPANGPTGIDSAGNRYHYAVHSYAGRSLADLSGVRVVVHYVAIPWPLPQGFESMVAGAFVRDGAAAVQCGLNGAVTIDRVTFVLPAP